MTTEPHCTYALLCVFACFYKSCTLQWTSWVILSHAHPLPLSVDRGIIYESALSQSLCQVIGFLAYICSISILLIFILGAIVGGLTLIRILLTHLLAEI